MRTPYSNYNACSSRSHNIRIRHIRRTRVLRVLHKSTPVRVFRRRPRFFHGLHVSPLQRLTSRPTRSFNRTLQCQRAIRQRSMTTRFNRQHLRLFRKVSRSYMRVRAFRVFTRRGRQFRDQFSKKVLRASPRNRRIIHSITIFRSIHIHTTMFKYLRCKTRNRLRLLRQTEAGFKTRGRHIIRHMSSNTTCKVQVLLIMRRTISRHIRVLRVLQRIRHTNRQSRHIRVHIRRAIMRKRRLTRHNRCTFHMTTRPRRIINLQYNSRYRQILTKLLRRTRSLQTKYMVVLRTNLFNRCPNILRATTL